MHDFPLVLDAPAKVNLALHVVGQRADGYHLLESLVTFADAGDRIGFRAAPQDGFSVSGRFSADLPRDADADAGNLVLKARDLLRAALTRGGLAAGPVHLHLEKNLPVSSGIGGGSADAAATLRGLLIFWETTLDHDTLQAIALKLGADVPMCLAGKPLIARGIGEHIARIGDMPSFPMLIVNPLKAVSTPVVFRMLATKTNAPLHLPKRQGAQEGWIDALRSLRNDLEPPARQLEPDIEAVCLALRDAGAALVRMSGSGASCFGLFTDDRARDRAADWLSATRPDWYVLACNSIRNEED